MKSEQRQSIGSDVVATDGARYNQEAVDRSPCTRNGGSGQTALAERGGMYASGKEFSVEKNRPALRGGQDTSAASSVVAVPADPSYDHAVVKAEPMKEGAADENGEKNGLGCYDECGDLRHPISGMEDPLRGYEAVESDYTKCNTLSFAKLVYRLEQLWKQRRRSGSKKKGKAELMNYLLPRELLDMEGSPFPVLRLIIPDLDVIRAHTGMKEKTIAQTWGAALALGKDSPSYLKLEKFNDPAYAGPTACGDLSLCLEEVMKERYPTSRSNMKLGKMNELLDELAGLKRRSREGNDREESTAHNWKHGPATSVSVSTVRPDGAERTKKASLATQRQEWVEKLLRLNLSPIEHKWVVRILLQKIEIGFGWQAILKHYHPLAGEVFQANNNLKTLCQKLSDPEWIRRRSLKEKISLDAHKAHNDKEHMPLSLEPAELGHGIVPMLSNRASFEKALSLISARHQSYLLRFPKGDPILEKYDKTLAFKHPAFLSEVKVDGERMLVHVNRGKVTMHTRSQTWYSNVYSPVLGPAIRRAIGYDVDVILDGEIVAWDNVKKEHIPFGNNRTVANIRRLWLESRGEIDERDCNLHDGQSEINTISNTRASVQLKEGEDPGSQCWLKFVVFDILYIGGPDSNELLKASCSHLTPQTSPAYANLASMEGSIIDLDGYHRKSILYRLIKPQTNQVDLVGGWVITSDGAYVTAEDYFSDRRDKRYGVPLPTLDSINCVKNGVVHNIAYIDEQRRNGRKDEDIAEERALALDKNYKFLVETELEEGCMYKDLAGPYVFGRSEKYWWKMKAEYEEAGWASDIDVIVLGANYATGLSKAGLLSHFLIGCVDQDSPDFRVMTLGRCSGGGTHRKNLMKLLEITGFKPATASDDVQYGKWFRCENHGQHGAVPEFVSKRSFQRCEGRGDFDVDGWRFKKNNYPDLWIHPDDSFVITINAGEIVSSHDYQAGVTLRFPRIQRIRVKEIDGDEKSCREAETAEGIRNLFYERKRMMQSKTTLNGGQRSALPSENDCHKRCRFLTQTAASKRKRTVKQRQRPEQVSVAKGSRIPTPSAKFASNILEGYAFAVLDGSYNIENDSLDAGEAHDQGWYEDAKNIDGRDSMMKFIQSHGGSCVLTGASSVDFVVGSDLNDVRVANYKRAIESASLADMKGKGKKDEALRIMMQKGVVKWTFVFSSVSCALKDIPKVKEESVHSVDRNTEANVHLTSSASIRELGPKIFKPKRFDYLVLSRAVEEALRKSENQYGVHVFEASSAVDFKRALGEVNREKKRKARNTSKLLRSRLQKTPPWQYNAFSVLAENELWVCAGKKQMLWPYQASLVRSRTVLYPDLFGDDFGMKLADGARDQISFEQRWKAVSSRNEMGAVASSLPLARAMGAQLTPHLCREVTHVLVEMQCNSMMKWRRGLSVSVFKNEETGRALHRRLCELDDEDMLYQRYQDIDVALVSPRWIRRLWSEGDVGQNG